jgi:F0F1-type ATP synthase assembly protein I
MKKNYLVFVFFTGIAFLGFKNLQGSQTLPFDSKKCQRELEVMKGILRTTLDFAGQEFSGGETSVTRGRFKMGPVFINPGNMTAFYLAGQGAVISIPASTIQNSYFRQGGHMNIAVGPEELDLGEFNEAMADLQEEMGDLSEELSSLGKEMSVKIANQVISSFPPPPPESPNAGQAPPLTPDKMKGKDSKKYNGLEADLKKKLSALQEKAKKRQEEFEARKAKFRANLEQVKGVLIEALANHGDSLTTVKPHEFINLVIVDEGGGWLANDADGRREIISVQKSIISEYKAGRLTLEEFKQKVLNYII